MSGAQLEALGNVRNVFPYVVNVGVKVTITVPVASFIGEAVITIDKSEIPFDRGPDKSARVFLSINNVSIVVSASAGTTSVINGAIYYRSGNAKRVYLMSISQLLASPTAMNNQLMASVAQAISAESVDNIGLFGFDNVASVAGTATNLIITVYANIGLYGDYAETDFTALMATKPHEHFGMFDVADIE